MATPTQASRCCEATKAFYREILDIDPGLTPDERRELQAAIGKAAVEAEPASAEIIARRTRAEQSRINGAKSRGPTSAQGKLASCMNAFQHGLRARPGLLPDEDPVAFEAFTDDLFRELAPASALQHQLVQRAAEMAWRLQRLPLIERQILSDAAAATGTPIFGDRGIDDLLVQTLGIEKDGVLLRLQRYGTRIERSLQSCIRELRGLQKMAAQLSDAPAIGTSAACSNGVAAPNQAAHAAPIAKHMTTASQDGVAARHRTADDGLQRTRNDSRSQRDRVISAACREVASAVGATVSLAGSVSGSFGTAAGAPAEVAVGTGTACDGLRFSGSFGAAAAMPMSTHASAVPGKTASATAAGSGSFGNPATAATTLVAAKGSMAAGAKHGKRQRPADWPAVNEVLPLMPAVFAGA